MIQPDLRNRLSNRLEAWPFAWRLNVPWSVVGPSVGQQASQLGSDLRHYSPVPQAVYCICTKQRGSPLPQNAAVRHIRYHIKYFCHKNVKFLSTHWIVPYRERWQKFPELPVTLTHIGETIDRCRWRSRLCNQWPVSPHAESAAATPQSAWHLHSKTHEISVTCNQTN